MNRARCGVAGGAQQDVHVQPEDEVSGGGRQGPCGCGCVWGECVRAGKGKSPAFASSALVSRVRMS